MRPTSNYEKIIISFFCFLLCFSFDSSAQSEKVKKIGRLKDFRSHLSVGGQKKLLAALDTLLDVKVNKILPKNGGLEILGTIEGSVASNLFFTFTNAGMEGKVVMPSLKKAYKYFSNQTGDVMVSSEDIDEVLCVEYFEAADSDEQFPVLAPPASSSVYKFESFPGAVAVVLLDFDGQYVSGTRWNGGAVINAAPSSFSENQITSIWRLISEDFKPFNINITTDSTKYFAAPSNRRMRCIFTSTDDASPGSGGVAYVNSFSSSNDNDSPCWVFNMGTKSAGEAGSHEIGHTLGLRHDGRISPDENYYQGHGSWAPIMGSGYSKSLVQWSKGEYSSADNTEDDLAIITKWSNGITYKTDDVGNTINTSKPFVILNDGSLLAADNSGIITQSSDIDVYSFTTTGGAVSLTVSPAAYYPDLDIYLKLTDAAGAEVASADPTNTLTASISTTLSSGTYYLHIDGTGNGSPTSTGYSDYASLGEYRVSGTIPNTAPLNAEPTVSIVSPENNDHLVPGTITITASASDPDGNISKVEFFNGTAKLGEDFDEPYTFSWNNIEEGSYTISAKATDNEGAEAQSMEVQIVVSQPKPPVVSIISPENNAEFTAPGSFTVSVNASDPEGAMTKVEFYNGTQLLGEDASQPYSFSYSDLSANTYKIIVVAIDASGLRAKDSININVLLPPDCNGESGGYAVLDNCGRCTGGNTGKEPCQGIVEAEESCRYDGETEILHTGFSGESYINIINATAASIQWELIVDSDHSTDVYFKYANGGFSNRPAEVYVNDTLVGILDFESTSAWNNWSLSELSISLIEGINKIELIALNSEGLANLDLLGYSSEQVSQGNCEAVLTNTQSPLSPTSVICYPNPFTTSININQAEALDYIIYDLAGAEVERGTGKENIGKDLLPGMYMLKIRTEKDTKSVKIQKL